QSAMFDRNTLIIAYDPLRGEPRGSRKRGLSSVLERARGLIGLEAAQASVVRAAHAEAARGGVRMTTGLLELPYDQAPEVTKPEDLGDCIDCTICVQVCPTGIDIRNGLQYECIACGACVDACNEVMDKVGYPRGLIRHTTQNAVDGRPSRVLRPRVLVYGVLLLAIFIGWSVAISQRTPLIVDVLRDRNALYRETLDGIENAYTLKISNKDTQTQRFRIEVTAAEGIELVDAPIIAEVAAESVLNLVVTLRAPAGSMAGRNDVSFIVTREDEAGVQAIRPTRFFGPL
ncbi:MAG TPA: FixG Ig-like domain-containing protein, partial [Xanthomonadaceae bacterium]|nr:FixG Ig-like domain-containing protein [Xanthomonadaceae bacterium]